MELDASKKRLNKAVLLACVAKEILCDPTNTPIYMICRVWHTPVFYSTAEPPLTVSPNVCRATARLRAFSFGYRVPIRLAAQSSPKIAKSGATGLSTCPTHVGGTDFEMTTTGLLLRTT